jgi:phospholipase/lecithinase/hemolysin
MSKKIASLFVAMVLSIFFISTANAALPAGFTKIYFFGDSLTDTGNYIGKGPYSYDDQDAPVTNRENGLIYGSSKTWANFLALSYGISSITPSKNGGTNWAVSRATTTTMMQNQILPFVANPPQDDPDHTLYVIWIGSNDLLAIKDKSEAEAVIGNGIMNIFDAISRLNDKVGAKNFLVVGVPDISFTPLYSNPVHGKTGEATDAAKVCAAWNYALFDSTDSPLRFLAQSGLNIYTFNLFKIDPASQKVIFDLVGAMAMQPTAFGFPKSITIGGTTYDHNNQLEWYLASHQDPSLKDPDQFIFHNYIHPTTHTHAVMADLAKKNAELLPN